MTYLLDTMVISYFLQAGREAALADAAQRCPMAIVDEVRDELERDRKRGGKTFRAWLATSGVNVMPIIVGSPASETLAALVSPASPTKNLGERACIALASSDPSLTLVTHDKGAAWIALRELWMPGERVLGLAAFLRRVATDGFDATVVDDLAAVALDPGQKPTWWAPWRAGLAS